MRSVAYELPFRLFNHLKRLKSKLSQSETSQIISEAIIVNWNLKLKHNSDQNHRYPTPVTFTVNLLALIFTIEHAFHSIGMTSKMKIRTDMH